MVVDKDEGVHQAIELEAVDKQHWAGDEHVLHAELLSLDSVTPNRNLRRIGNHYTADMKSLARDYDVHDPPR